MNVNEQYQELLDAAFAAMQHAYAPYSRYHVGACVKTKDGTLIPGANIENASFGLTNCAERSAIFAAYSMGYRREDIVAIAIVSDGTKLAAPCGACTGGAAAAGYSHRVKQQAGAENNKHRRAFTDVLYE